jgi:hypothetical protein
MVKFQPSKLAMRVRFPLPALPVDLAHSFSWLVSRWDLHFGQRKSLPEFLGSHTLGIFSASEMGSMPVSTER